MDLENAIQLILIIHDYLDDFPKELSYMLPKREIKFSINVLLGMILISKAPNYIGYMKLRKLIVSYRHYKLIGYLGLVVSHGVP